MDIFQAAAMDPAARDAALIKAGATVDEARWVRGTLSVGHVIAELRRLAPQAATVRFDGPQEPGDTASIGKILDADGGVLYDGDTEEGVVDFDDLTEAQDFLTGALEDGMRFQHGRDGDYELLLVAP